MRLTTRVLTIAGALLALGAAPLSAITFGQLDGDEHPDVGAMVVRIGTDVFPVCSGTLVGPARDEPVFLTAAHCTAFLDEVVPTIPGAEVLVTFDSKVDAAGDLIAAEWVTNPGWAYGKGKGGKSDAHDVAVLLLEESPSGVTPARLPTAGLLDQLHASGALRSARFTAVGYGAVRETMTKAFQTIDNGNLDRRRAEQGFNALTKAWLHLPMINTPGNENGGTCYGDSGGPHFIHLDGRETNIVVSVTSTGDRPCKALDTTYRVDTASARDFLDDYLTLP